jgi:CubicO group peptidase (beta-lactamase class C family)
MSLIEAGIPAVRRSIASFCQKGMLALAALIIVPNSAAVARTSLDRAEKIDSIITKEMERLDAPGLSIALIESGEITSISHFGVKNRASGEPITSETLFEAASLSKPIFAHFALIQANRGVIELDRPLAEYMTLPDIDDPRAQKITARMVLSHRTGFPNWRFENEDGQLDIKFEPGEQFSYSGEGFEYLATVIADQLGTDVTNLGYKVRSDLMEPVGANNSRWRWDASVSEHVATGYSGKDAILPWQIEKLMASASLHVTAHDYARLILAGLDGFELSSTLRDEMLSEQSKLSEDDDFRTDFGLDAWGLGYALKDTPCGAAITHGGINQGFTSWFVVLKETRTGYVFFTNSETAPQLNIALEQALISC